MFTCRYPCAVDSDITVEAAEEARVIPFAIIARSCLLRLSVPPTWPCHRLGNPALVACFFRRPLCLEIGSTETLFGSSGVMSMRWEESMLDDGGS
jgi:hypothetical protein